MEVTKSALTNASVNASQKLDAIEAQLASLTQLVKDMRVIANLEQSTWPQAGSLGHTQQELANILAHWSLS